ncbi:DUF4259 domain-containing protein [Kitasatospora sp. NPDC059463]|uniref:DUF4259 domain-containing protein n=1 Tax=unclassified Kitasatospora TaxID=2633591 RepID=UPI0036C8DA6C
MSGSWDTGPFHNDTATGIADRFDTLFPDELPPFLHRLFDTATSVPDSAFDTELAQQVIAASAVIASQRPAGAGITLSGGPWEPVPALPQELGPKAVAALDRVLANAEAEVVRWHDGARGEQWLANVVQIRLAIQDEPPPLIGYTPVTGSAAVPSAPAPPRREPPAQADTAAATVTPRPQRRVFAGQQYVQGRLGVDDAWDLPDRHPKATTAHALAGLVEHQASEVDSLDRELRAVAARAAEALTPIAQGDHRGVQHNGVLRFTGVELESLGARFDLAQRALQDLVARYERAAANVPAALPRETAARARSTVRLSSSPTAAPAAGVLAAPSRPLHP